MMNRETLILLAVFWILALWTLLHPGRRSKLFSRKFGIWMIDLTGLTIHGVVVPLFQAFLIFGLLKLIAPQFRGALNLNPFLSFALSFVFVDYAYYWNHRLLHRAKLWRFHAVHHSGPTFDIFTTSRNSAVTTFLILYVWVNGFLLFVLHDPAPLIWGIVLSNALDILRHSGIRQWPNLTPLNFVISPREHAWHHSPAVMGVNFGANLNLWDRLHGTYYSPNEFPEVLGSELSTNSWSAFWKGSP